MANIVLIFTYRIYREINKHVVELHTDLPELNELLRDNTRTSKTRIEQIKIYEENIQKISGLEERIRKLERERK